MNKTLNLTDDEAWNIANDCASYNDRRFEDVKIVDLDRERYHMRQLVMVKDNDVWYGFEFFDALDKHGESEIGESYVDGESVTAYEVIEKAVTTYEYAFASKQLEEY
jgi:hypothetical protein